MEQVSVRMLIGEYPRLGYFFSIGAGRGHAGRQAGQLTSYQRSRMGSEGVSRRGEREGVGVGGGREREHPCACVRAARCCRGELSKPVPLQRVRPVGVLTSAQDS